MAFSEGFRFNVKAFNPSRFPGIVRGLVEGEGGGQRGAYGTLRRNVALILVSALPRSQFHWGFLDQSPKVADEWPLFIQNVRGRFRIFQISLEATT